MSFSGILTEIKSNVFHIKSILFISGLTYISMFLLREYETTNGPQNFFNNYMPWKNLALELWYKMQDSANCNISQTSRVMKFIFRM